MPDGFVRLDGHLPVRVPGGVALCPELTLDALRLDLLDGASLPAGDFAATLLLSDRLDVGVTLRVEGAGEPGPLGRPRVLVRVLGYEGDGRGRLVGHVSALRKSAHLHLAATADVQGTRPAGWERWALPHVALPELDLDALDLRVPLLGKTLRAPLLVAGMTGGSERAATVNRRLAAVAQELGFAFGLGSQRAMLEDVTRAASFRVRDVAPDVLLLANVGLVSLNHGVRVDDVRRLVDGVGADALALHLNVLQELVQPEGDRRWAGLWGRLEELARALPVPIVLKETGCGLDAATARRAVDAGVAALDVGGRGGTSWGWIEGLRAADPQRQEIGATFRDWGTATPDAVVAVRAAVGEGVPVIATGGVRSGLDVGKALALGADAAGVALPFFRAADLSAEDALALGRRLVLELGIALVCSGSATPAALRGKATEARG